ncbi:MAG: ATP-binding cassette domain-containing protein [Propionibacterium sp.]|nr:ATP-binding cassette domain-containing protein [Propionibacterium sp.]
MATITARGWGWRHAGRREWAVRDVDFDIADGEHVLLLGPSGSGKSTLLAAIAGVLGGPDEGDEAGLLLVDGRHPTRCHGRVGLVQQDPESNIILARVGDDVAFGPENLGVPRDLIWPRVWASLEAVGLDLPLDHPSGHLSGGQKQRLAIAGSLALSSPTGGAGTSVLLLDEPTANLDPSGVVEVRDTVTRLARERGVTLLVVEHRVDVWASLVDRVIVLDPVGGLLADGEPAEVFAAQREALVRAGVWVPGVGSGLTPLPAASGTPVLSGERLGIGYVADRPVRTGLAVDLPRGVSSVITGDNGTGKTTLALTLAGLLPRLGGRVVAAPDLSPPPRRGRRSRRRPSATGDDPGDWTSRELLTRIGTVFQQPEHQFVAGTVRDELAVGLDALGWPPHRADRRVEELLGALRLDRVAAANPFTLSGGEKRRLSVATVLAAGPEVIVLDEPTFGQDRTTWLELVSLVRRMLDEGRTIVSVTHDAAYIAALGQHRIDLGAA